MTNEERILSLIKTNNSILNAILAERLLTIAQLSRESINNNREAFRTPFTSPEAYEQLCSNIEDIFRDDYKPEHSEYILFMGEEEFEFYTSEIVDSNNLAAMIQGLDSNELNDYEIIQFDPLGPAYKMLDKANMYHEWVYIYPEQLEALKAANLI